MAKVKKEKGEVCQNKSFIEQMIEDINLERNAKLAYCLESDEPPTIVKYYIPTGSRLLDIAISNMANGGMPGGRLIEIHGQESCVSGDTIVDVIICDE